MSGHGTGPSGPEERVDRVADTAETNIREAQVGAESQIADAREVATEKVRSAEQQVKAKIRETEAKVREQVAEVERVVGGFKGLSEPTPAGSVDEAARQASDLRRAIDHDLDVLQSRLPPGEELAEKAKTYGGAAVGVLAVAGAAALGLKQRAERKRIEREARAHADAIARYLPQASDAPRGERKGRGGLMLLVLIAAAVGAVVVRQRTGEGGGPEPDLWGPA